jgi:hypothetical protein
MAGRFVKKFGSNDSQSEKKVSFPIGVKKELSSAASIRHSGK